MQHCSVVTQFIELFKQSDSKQQLNDSILRVSNAFKHLRTHNQINETWVDSICSLLGLICETKESVVLERKINET